MFGEIAPRYDFLNRLLSFGIDRSWRRRAVRRAVSSPGGRVLDLCCGTGDLALELAAAGAEVHGADFTGPMLVRAHEKAAAPKRKGAAPAWVRADAMALPYADASFDAVTIAFGIRNVVDPRAALAECRRVLRPGGSLLVLEFFPIRNRLWKAVFGFYFAKVLPLLARVVRAGRTGAYTYLPASVEEFAQVEEFRGWMEEAGLDEVEDRPLTGGVARLVVGRAGPPAGAPA